MFSIIIPCFNNADFLRATLTSITWQNTTQKVEVILVDNNSSFDNPDTIYHEFFDKLNLYLVKQPKLNHTFAPCRARNIALRLASHPWIISLDADILLNKDYLNSLEILINNCGNAILTAERVFIDGSKVNEIDQKKELWPEEQLRVRSPANYYLLEDRRLPAMTHMSQLEHPWAFMHGCNLIFPKDLALKIGGYDEEYDGHWGYEDIDFAFRLIQNHASPMYFPELYCYHLEIPRTEQEELKRFDKTHNPNWERICKRIPGFKEYKEKEYRQISELIKL